MTTKKKTKTSSKPKKKSLKQRLQEKKAELKNRNSRSNIFKQKDEGTLRVRVLYPGDGEEFVREITQFWLGKDKGGASISPASLGKDCALMEKYQELKEGDEFDKDIAKTLMPKNRYVMPVLIYKDERGKVIDTELSGKLMMITGGVYQSIIDLYLDEDEWGDMTDPKEGYDIKITREGTGMKDTNYSIQPCKNTPLPKAYRERVDLDALVSEEVDTYEQTVEKTKAFMGNLDEDEEEETPKKSVKKKGVKKKLKKKLKKKVKSKKRKSDI